MKSKTEIIHEVWDKGGSSIKNQLGKYRLTIEAFAYHCMKRLEDEPKEDEPK